jgi:fructoselysine-6-P-deglycase FrlB-like protein
MISVGDYLRKETSLIPEIISRQMLEQYKVPAYLRNRHGVATGAGDSMVVAEILQYISGGKILAMDPYEVILNPPSWDEGVIVGISIKGRTREVINALRSLKGRRGWVALGITAEENSPLARSSDYVVKILYKGGEVPVGVGNFVSAVAAVSAIYGIHTSGMPDVSNDRLTHIDFNRAKDVVLVGSGLGRILAEFIALKLYEVLCKPARTYASEQFLHAPIYTLDEETNAIFIGDDARTRRAYEIVRNSGLKVTHLSVKISSLSDFINVLKIAMISLAHNADELMLSKPCFMLREPLLKESTPEIYGE